MFLFDSPLQKFCIEFVLLEHC